MFANIGLMGALVLAAIAGTAASPATGSMAVKTDADQPALERTYELINDRLCRMRAVEMKSGDEVQVEFYTPDDEPFENCRDAAMLVLPDAAVAGTSQAATIAGTVAALTPAAAIALGILSIKDEPRIEQPVSR